MLHLSPDAIKRLWDSRECWIFVGSADDPQVRDFQAHVHQTYNDEPSPLQQVAVMRRTLLGCETIPLSILTVEKRSMSPGDVALMLKRMGFASPGAAVLQSLEVLALSHTEEGSRAIGRIFLDYLGIEPPTPTEETNDGRGEYDEGRIDELDGAPFDDGA